MTNIYVYLYRDPARNNEPIYVGMGRGKRAWAHLKRTDVHPFVRRLQKMIRLGGEPSITMIAENLDLELAVLVEQEAIDLYGRRDLCKGPLLNLTDGGDGCFNPGLSTLAKISLIRKGAVLSEETKAKISKAHTGKALSAEHRAAIGKGVSISIRPPCSEEKKIKIGNANRGKKRTDEVKAQISIRQLGTVRSQEAIIKTAEANRGQKRSEETKAKLRAAWERRRG